MKIRPTRRTALTALPAGLAACVGLLALAVGAVAAPAATSTSAAAPASAPATTAAASTAPTTKAPATTAATSKAPTSKASATTPSVTAKAAPTSTAAESTTSSTGPTKPSTGSSAPQAPAPTSAGPGATAAADLQTSIALSTVNGTAASSSTVIHAGDVLVYAITVTNSGTAAGTLKLSVDVPANTTYAATETVWNNCSKGSPAGTTCAQTATLPAGNKGTTTFTVQAVNPLPAGVVSISNTVHVSTGSCTACTVGNATAANLHTTVKIVTVNGHAATSATHLARGDKVGYLVSVSNDGGSSGTATVVDAVPTHATFSGSGWSCASGATAGTSCTRAVTVAAGATVTASYLVTLTTYPGDTKTITDAVSASTGSCSACSVSNQTVAFLVTSKEIYRVGTGLVSSSVSLSSGDRVVYHITVSNTGGSTGSTTLTDAVPAHTTYVGQGQGWSCGQHSSPGTSCTQKVSVGTDAKVVLRYTVLIGSSSGAAFSSVTNSVTTSAGTCSGCTVTNSVSQEASLADTGIDTAGQSGIGVGLLGFGVLLTVAGRRRRTG